MTEAGWTSKKPIVAGWYWWRGKEESGIALVFPADKPMPWHTSDHSAGVQLFYSAGGMSSTRVNDFGGEWLGPITPDSYQQGWVAGIKAVRRKITDLIDRGFTDCEEDMDDLIDWIDFQLAQQAQEGGVGDGKV